MGTNFYICDNVSSCVFVLQPFLIVVSSLDWPDLYLLWQWVSVLDASHQGWSSPSIIGIYVCLVGCGPGISDTKFREIGHGYYHPSWVYDDNFFQPQLVHPLCTSCPCSICTASKCWCMLFT